MNIYKMNFWIIISLVIILLALGYLFLQNDPNASIRDRIEKDIKECSGDDYYYKSLNLDYITSPVKLDLSKAICPTFNLNGLTSAKGLVLPDTVYSLNLNGLVSVKGLIIPKSVMFLELNSLTSAEGLIIPESVENLSLRSLTSAKGLVLNKLNHNYGPSGEDEIIDPPPLIRRLSLERLTSVEGFVLPNSSEDLYINSITAEQEKELLKNNPQFTGKIFVPLPLY